jgi:hypothetical protein
VSKKSIHILVIAMVFMLMLVTTLFILVPILFSSPLKGEKAFDFGVVPIDRPDTILEHTFLLTNVTDHSLRLVDATPTCGCTTTDWPDEPVPPNGQFVVPVHLKLKQSRFRGSRIRLEFETGEVVVLEISGTGRFKQPLQSLPPAIRIVNGYEKGTRALLTLEWFKVSTPPMPTFITPENVRVVPQQWVLSKEGNYRGGIPDKWTLQMLVFLDSDLIIGSDLLVEMEDAPKFYVSLIQVDSVEQPFLSDINK